MNIYTIRERKEINKSKRESHTTKIKGSMTMIVTKNHAVRIQKLSEVNSWGGLVEFCKAWHWSTEDASPEKWEEYRKDLILYYTEEIQEIITYKDNGEV